METQAWICLLGNAPTNYQMFSDQNSLEHKNDLDPSILASAQDRGRAGHHGSFLDDALERALERVMFGKACRGELSKAPHLDSL